MELVLTIEDLKENLRSFDNLLCNGTDQEKKFVKSRIKNGLCLVAYTANGKMKFAPSRYIGYANNNMDKHLSNKSKNGRETNPAINKIMNKDPISNELLEKEYLNFLGELSLQPAQKSRKYWAKVLQIEVL